LKNLTWTNRPRMMALHTAWSKLEAQRPRKFYIKTLTSCGSTKFNRRHGRCHVCSQVTRVKTIQRQTQHHIVAFLWVAPWLYSFKFLLANQIHRSPQYPDGESSCVTTWPIDSRRNILPTLSHTTRTTTRLLTLIGSLQFGQVLVSQAFYPKESKDTDKNLIGNLQFGLARIYLYFNTTALELYR